VLITHISRVGNHTVEGHALAGVGAPGDKSFQVIRVKKNLGIENGTLIGVEC